MIVYYAPKKKIIAFEYAKQHWDETKNTYQWDFVEKLLKYIDQHITNLVDFEFVKQSYGKPYFKKLIDYYMFANATYIIDQKPKIFANEMSTKKLISTTDHELYTQLGFELFKKYYHCDTNDLVSKSLWTINSTTIWCIL